MLFGGISLLAHLYGIVPADGTRRWSRRSRASRSVGGRLYYLVQAATVGILVLAANTAFADFPRLSFFLARDGFLPRQFSFRGDRLAFSDGIVALGVLSAALVVIFRPTRTP